MRPGDNLYTESIVAIDARTGEYKWHYQQVPHDVWDFDATSPPVIVKLKNGKTAVAEAGKTAFVYVLDAETGKLIRKSEEFNRHENYFVQPTADGVRMLPGANGGSEWSPPAVNPNLGYMYVLGLEQPMNYITHSAPLEKGKLWLGSAFKAVPGEKQYGTFTAIDLNTGKRAWQVKTDQPMIGGALATAGNLVFTGEGNGHFNAYDARTGKTLWSFTGGAGCNAPPVIVLGRWQAVHCGGVRRQLSARLSVGRCGDGVRAARQCRSHEESEIDRDTPDGGCSVRRALRGGNGGQSQACDDVGNVGSRDCVGEWSYPGKVVADTGATRAGRDWQRFGPKEKEAYLAGFIAGAAAARGSAGGGEYGYDAEQERSMSCVQRKSFRFRIQCPFTRPKSTISTGGRTIWTFQSSM